MKTPALRPKTSLLRNPALRSFSLIEMTISMVILSIMAGMVAFAAASMDRSLILMDINSAMNDELSRQAEILKNTNIDLAFGYTVAAPAPIGTTPAAGPQVIPPANVNQLQGFLPVNDTATANKPTITWSLFRTNFVNNVGHKALMDRIIVTASYQVSGFPLLSNATAVIKVFDADQQ